MTLNVRSNGMGKPTTVCLVPEHQNQKSSYSFTAFLVTFPNWHEPGCQQCQQWASAILLFIHGLPSWLAPRSPLSLSGDALLLRIQVSNHSACIFQISPHSPWKRKKVNIFQLELPLHWFGDFCKTHISKNFMANHSGTNSMIKSILANAFLSTKLLIICFWTLLMSNNDLSWVVWKVRELVCQLKYPRDSFTALGQFI